MKHLRTFEGASEEEKSRIKKEIEDWFVLQFVSEDDFNEFLLDVNGVSDLDEIDWNQAPFDVEHIMEKDYPELTHNELLEILVEIISEVDLDDYNEARDGDYDEWLLKKSAKQYNL